MDDIHSLCGMIVDVVMKYSMKKYTSDNITCVFICFANFKQKMMDDMFERANTEVSVSAMEGEVDLSGFDVSKVKNVVLNPSKRIKLLNVVNSNK